MSGLEGKAAEHLKTIRETSPLIHNITNFVVMNFTANSLLAMGASPVMAHAPEEVEEMAGFAGALVLNIGTLAADWVDSMILAGKKASELDKPVILDPVGAGATSMRTESAMRIVRETRVSVIRGNASEILSLSASDGKTKGVDSVHAVDAAEESARHLAMEMKTVLAVTGPVDLVTDGDRVLRISNGHPMMGRITGTGCSATAIVAAFAAVEPDYAQAAALGLAFFGIAGEKAAKKASAPGGFMVQLLDALYEITPEEFSRNLQIRG